MVEFLTSPVDTITGLLVMGAALAVVVVIGFIIASYKHKQFMEKYKDK